MKIAFIGTHGTGKTTLSHSLTADLKKMGVNAAMVNEISSKCPLPINENSSFKTQLWIMSAQICEELEASDKYPHIICDRSILDGYTYAVVIGCANEFLEKIAESWIKTYDYLFKVPVTKPIEADGIRSTDKKFQTDVDEMMEKVLQEKKIKFFRLPKESQIDFIKKTIGFA